MSDIQKHRLLYIIGGSFILLLAIFLYYEQFWILGLPIALAFVGVALFKLDWLFLIITFLTPLSINVEDVGGGGGIGML